MKKYSFILAVIILSLALKPCDGALNESCNDEIVSNEGHNHPNDLEDSCSILCICNCCGQTITLNIPSDIQINLSIIRSEDNLSSNKLRYYYHLLSDIWQPPKMM